MSLDNLRHQAQQTLDELCRKAKACGLSNRLNLLVQGHMVIQQLENGLRPGYLFKLGVPELWEALGVMYDEDLADCHHNRDSNMPQSTSTRPKGHQVAPDARASLQTDHNHSSRRRSWKGVGAAAAGRELAWQTGGGDPAARSSSDACVLVRCTICSSACVHVPCPVPGCGLQQCERCRHDLCVVPAAIIGLYGSDGELVTACRPSGSKCLTHATLEQMERNAAEVQERRNAADARAGVDD